MVKKSFGFLKTTAFGGVIFLLPLVVVGILLGQLYSIIAVMIEPARNALPDEFESPSGLALLVSIAILILLSLCFICEITELGEFW